MKNDKSNTMRISLIQDIPDVPLSEAPQPAKPAAGILVRPARPDDGSAQQSADQQRRGYDGLFQNLYDAAIVTDMHGRIRDVNPRAEAAFGYTPAQFSHLTLDNVISGADTDLVRTLFEKLCREQRFSLLEANCIRADGSAFPAEVSVSALQLSTPHLCFLIRDETVREQTNVMLRTEHNAIQNSADAIVVIRSNTTIEYANPATANIWGYATAEELTDQPLGKLLLNPDDANAIIDSLSGENYQSTGVAVAKHADGDAFRVEIRAACNRTSDGSVAGAVISFSDLTDRDRVEVAERDAENFRAAMRDLKAYRETLVCDAGEIRSLLDSPELASALTDPAVKAKLETAKGALDGMESVLEDAAERFKAQGI